MTTVAGSELGWLAEQLGLRLEVQTDVLGGGLDRMAGLALRRNPRRAHLLVSRLLGKHLPVEPATALSAGAMLAGQLPPEVRAGEPLVVGFAETATALGHAVAAALPGALYVCSTRRPGPSALEFTEEHSHATDHRVLAARSLLATPAPVVLVDDELSTGRTAINTIRALHTLAPRPSYTVATLLDVRPTAFRADLEGLADELGVPVRAVALLSGRLEVPADAAQAAAPLVARGDPPLAPTSDYPVEVLDPPWPAELPLGGRSGWGPELEEVLSGAVKPVAEALAEVLAGLPRPVTSVRTRARRVLVLGTEELMYVPMRIAAALADSAGAESSGRAAAVSVWTQSTTRSPVVPLDRDGYAVRTALAFPAPDEPDRTSFLYNVAAGDYDAIVLVTDPPAAAGAADLLQMLAGCAPVVHLRLPEAQCRQPEAQ